MRALEEDMEQVEAVGQSFTEEGYGDHSDLWTETWMESHGNGEIYLYIECKECESWFRAHFLENPRSPLWTQCAERAVKCFKEDVPELCEDAKKLNLVKDVMLS